MEKLQNESQNIAQKYLVLKKTNFWLHLPQAVLSTMHNIITDISSHTFIFPFQRE